MVRRAGWSLMALVLVCLTASAQTPQPPGAQPPGGGRGGPQGPPVVSPEVNRDRTITVRVSTASRFTSRTVTSSSVMRSTSAPTCSGRPARWSSA